MNGRKTLLVITIVTLAQSCSGADSAERNPDVTRTAPRAVSDSALANRDSVVAEPGKFYDASSIHRVFFGELHRDVWKIPLKVEVLSLDSIGGGLIPLERSGGAQTPGLRFTSKHGGVYQFRSMVKDPAKALSPVLQRTAFARLLDDQMAAQFPYAPLLAAELAEATGVLVARPKLVVMPDDERLGEFRDAFAGRIGWIELRPQGARDGSPGFAGASEILDTESLYEELQSNGNSFVDSRSFLKARLLDILIGDWDRHQGQWSWARFDEAQGSRWVPIPRDRDWAFPAVDGVIWTIASPILVPQYVGFTGRFPPAVRLTWAARDLDRNFLSCLSASEFSAITSEFIARLTDTVLDRAVATLPSEYEQTRKMILQALQQRRAELPDFALRMRKLTMVVPTWFGIPRIKAPMCIGSQ